MIIIRYNIGCGCLSVKRENPFLRIHLFWIASNFLVIMKSHLQTERKQLFPPGVSEYVIDGGVVMVKCKRLLQPITNRRPSSPSHSSRSSSDPASRGGLMDAVVMEIQEVPQLQIRLPWKCRQEMLLQVLRRSARVFSTLDSSGASVLLFARRDTICLL